MASRRRWDNLIPYLILIVLSITWGSSFILIKKGLRSFSPEEIGNYRIAASWVALSGIALFNVRRWNWKDIPYLSIVGFCGNFFPALLFAFAQESVPSSLAGILNALVPIFTVVIGAMFFSSKFTKWQVYGVFIGLAGSAALALGANNPSEATSNNIMTGALMIVGATLCYAISLNTIKHKLSHLPSLHITSFSFFITGPVAASLLYWNTNFFQREFNHQQLLDLGAITTLSLVGTALALILFNILIKKSSTVFSSYVTYVIPVVALVWGLFDGETLNFIQLIGGAVVLAGVVLSRKR